MGARSVKDDLYWYLDVKSKKSIKSCYLDDDTLKNRRLTLDGSLMILITETF